MLQMSSGGGRTVSQNVPFAADWFLAKGQDELTYIQKVKIRLG